MRLRPLTEYPELSVLEQSNVIYHIKADPTNNSRNIADGLHDTARGSAEYNDRLGKFLIKLGSNSLGLLAHELKHAYQFETGQISFGKLDKETFYDLTDEDEAYTRGRLFNDTYPSDLSKQYH